MKVNLVGRLLRAKATVFVGLAMMLAVVLGAVSVAQAAPGDPFLLGRINSAFDRVSQLVGFPAGPVLRIDNNSASSGATALDLQVEPGKAPMTVNSSARVVNLNADQIDSKDSGAFLSSNHYAVAPEPSIGTGTGTVRRLEAHCRPGDLPLGGGVANVDPGTVVLSNFPELRFTPPGWVVSIQNDSITSLDNASAVVLCADQ